MPLAEKDNNNTSLTSDAGTNQFNRMAFGLMNTPATVQRAPDIMRSRLT